jgi:MoaA/NifB/PqqE/SkfB family radical SAM enzyme
MLAYKKICEQLVEAGANEFSPALHGHTAALHDYLTKADGSFKQTVRSIVNLKELGQLVITNSVITRANYRHLPELASLLTSLGVDQFQLAFVHPLGAANENFTSIVPRLSLVEPFVKKGLDIGLRAGRSVMTEAIPYCFMKGYEPFIGERVIPRTKIMEGHVTIQDYTLHRLTEGKAKGPMCAECAFCKMCEGPWREYPEKYGWEEFVARKDFSGAHPDTLPGVTDR